MPRKGLVRLQGGMLIMRNSVEAIQWFATWAPLLKGGGVGGGWFGYVWVAFVGFAFFLLLLFPPFSLFGT